MKSEWWIHNFNASYHGFMTIFQAIIISSISIRVVLGFLFSFEILYGSPQLQLTTLIVVVVVILYKLEHSTNTKLKQIILYITIEAFNIGMRLACYRLKKNDEILCFLNSTLVTILFQTNIFQNHYSVFFIICKHLFI